MSEYPIWADPQIIQFETGKGGSKAQSLPPVVTFGSPAKHSPAVQELQETPFQSLVQEDSLEEKRATHSSTLAWKEFHGQRSPGITCDMALRVLHGTSLVV